MLLAPEVHQNDHSYVREFAGLIAIIMQECSMVGGYKEDLEKLQNCQMWGVHMEHHVSQNLEK